MKINPLRSNGGRRGHLYVSFLYAGDTNKSLLLDMICFHEQFKPLPTVAALPTTPTNEAKVKNQVLLQMHSNLWYVFLYFTLFSCISLSNHITRSLCNTLIIKHTHIYDIRDLTFRAHWIAKAKLSKNKKNLSKVSFNSAQIDSNNSKHPESLRTFTPLSYSPPTPKTFSFFCVFFLCNSFFLFETLFHFHFLLKSKHFANKIKKKNVGPLQTTL